ncbi:hypothetical protein B0H15DRAFT_785521 [Mycena belliarum]|uniref:BTB domain-containing protein n=1 Tax=Mycena belliarum TaxID=1033014 RepID=A0AAD6TX20_9AGAR|nr:hypothetical protein B0H15DRAFT_785521 [Mycena belliae]
MAAATHNTISTGKDIAHERSAPCAPPSPVYHPAFSAAADIMLESSDGTLYRIDLYTLRATSGFFNTMLSLPAPEGGHKAEPIPLHAPDDAVEPLLRLMCGMYTHPWRTLDEIEAVLQLAENWDTPGPIAYLRTALDAPKWRTADPIRLYALATHFTWRAEAQRASTAALALDLFAPEHADALARLPAPALVALLRLHRARRDVLRALLDSPDGFLAGNGEPFHCSACAFTPLDNRSWRALKIRLVREIERAPAGEALGVLVGGMAEWPETRACWDAKCSRPECGAANYDRIATLKQIRSCVNALPVAVDLDWD